MELLIINERAIYLLFAQGFCACRSFDANFNYKLTTLPPPAHIR